MVRIKNICVTTHEPLSDKTWNLKLLSGDFRESFYHFAHWVNQSDYSRSPHLRRIVMWWSNFKGNLLELRIKPKCVRSAASGLDWKSNAEQRAGSVSSGHRVPRSLRLYPVRTLWSILLSTAQHCLARGWLCNGDVKMLHKMAVRKCMGAIKSFRILLKGQYRASVLSMHIVLLQ